MFCFITLINYYFYLHWYLLTLKNYVRNKSLPEGSIMEGYFLEEVTTFCSRYLEGSVETKLNRPLQIPDGPIDKGASKRMVAAEIFAIHRFILLSIDRLEPYRK